MKTTERFDRAVTKLYNAFHNRELDACDCKKCAVGNMCDNDYRWSNDRSIGVGPIRSGSEWVNMTGYSMMELCNIEYLFMHGHKIGEDISYRRFHRNMNQDKDKEINFMGLCAVVEYLCELDNIPNVLDFTKLFEYDKENQPVYQL